MGGNYLSPEKKKKNIYGSEECFKFPGRKFLFVFFGTNSLSIL